MPSGEGMGLVSQNFVARIVRTGPPVGAIATMSDNVAVCFQVSKTIDSPSGVHLGLISSGPP